MGSMVPVAWARVVSQAAFLPSLMAFLRCSASWRSCSNSFMVASLLLILVVVGGAAWRSVPGISWRA
jgi:hypothetical protein